MKNRETVVLVTCVGSGVGQSIIDSLNLNGGYNLIGCDGNRNVYAHSFCDKFIVVPNLYSECYVQHILDLCIENNVDIVIPGHDHELLIFAQKYQLFKDNGVELLISDPNIIEVSRDKKKWFDYFSSKGCSIVPTFKLKDFLDSPDLSIFPAIIKPTGGSASQGIYIVNEFNQIPNILEDNLIIQPYLFPEKLDRNYQRIKSMVDKGKFLQMSEISIQLIFDKEAKFKNVFISNNVLKNGVPVHVDPINPKEFKYLDDVLKFVPVLEGNNVRGPVNIQGRVTDKGIYFFEMNMRFTGITGNRALLGFNEVAYLVNNFLGKDAKLKEYSFNKVGVRQVACTTIPRTTEIKELTILGGGSNVGEYFIKKNISPKVKVSLIARESSVEKYKKLFENYNNIQIISDTDEYLDNYLTSSDALVNFVSALANTSEEKIYDAIRFVQRLIPKITKAKIAKIINISSQSVYNQSLDEEKTEESEVLIDRAYAFQKIMMEDLFASVNQFNPLTKVVSLRLTRILNPEDIEQCGFFGKVVSELKNGNLIHIQTPLNKTNLIHVQDVSNVINFMLNKMNDFETTMKINVGGGNISMKEFSQKTQEVLSLEGIVTYGKQESAKIASVVDDSKIRQLGWGNEKSIIDIIKEM